MSHIAHSGLEAGEQCILKKLQIWRGGLYPFAGTRPFGLRHCLHNICRSNMDRNEIIEAIHLHTGATTLG